jgi:DNA primase
MQLIINNCNITTPIYDIVESLKQQTNGEFFDYIYNEGDYIRVTCPFHKNGHENKPSASVYARYDNPEIMPGTFHCFTCDKVVLLPQLVSYCLHINIEEAKQWLVNKFGGENKQITPILTLEPIELNKQQEHVLDEGILDYFESWHPYLAKRKLSKDICEQFEVKYDPKTDCVVFPVRENDGRLAFLTRRSVTGKQFYIDKDIEKPVYLLNYIIKNNIQTVVVCESQINALTLWGWNIPAIALFGCKITQYQLNQLNKSPIKHYILALDGDKPGWSGMYKFIKSIRQDVFVDIKLIPKGKDVNDLSQEEYDKLPLIDSFDFIKGKIYEQN